MTRVLLSQENHRLEIGTTRVTASVPGVKMMHEQFSQYSRGANMQKGEWLLQ